MILGDSVQGYEIIAKANGYVMAHSSTAPSPYVVWKLDADGNGVSWGHYFADREEAEWDFCARAFEWFEDNMYIHVIEDNPPIEQNLVDGLRAIRSDMARATQLVGELCAEVEKLKERRHNDNYNH